MIQILNNIIANKIIRWNRPNVLNSHFLPLALNTLRISKRPSPYLKMAATKIINFRLMVTSEIII